MDAPTGTIVSFSTQAGQTAETATAATAPTPPPSSGVSRKPRKSARSFAISADVYEASGRAQLPELSLSIIGKFYLNGPISITVNPPAPASPPTFARPLKRTGRRRTRSARPAPSKIMLQDFLSAHLPISPRRGSTS